MKKIKLILKDKDLNTEKYFRLCHSHTSVKTKMELLGKFATIAQMLFNKLFGGKVKGEGMPKNGYMVLNSNKMLNIHLIISNFSL